jgi:hypothetical protein
MDYIFNEDLDQRFAKLSEAKQMLSNVSQNEENPLIDTYAVRKEFLYYSFGGIIYLGCLARYMWQKSRFYANTGRYRNIFLHIIPFGLLNLIIFNKSLEFCFDYVVKKKFVEKILEFAKNEPEFENRKKLMINQLTYYTNHIKNTNI